MCMDFFLIDFFLKLKKNVWQIAIVRIESGLVRFGHDYINTGAIFSF